MRHSYTTRQKQVILACLEERRNESLTVDGICALLLGSGEKIGRSTVYRKLEELCREGEISRFAPEVGKSVTYRFIGKECGDDCHFHLICTSCGTVCHTHCPQMEELLHHMKEEHAFCVDEKKTVLYGLCKNCVGGIE